MASKCRQQRLHLYNTNSGHYQRHQAGLCVHKLANTLIMLAVVVITIVFNTWGSPIFPQLEVASLIGHIAGFFVVAIPLWVLCDLDSANDVFTSFTDQSGWDNMGMAYLTCQVYVIYCNLGSDSVFHISEEVGDASLIVPRCMWWSYVGNVLFGIVMLITMPFCIGPLQPVVSLS